MELTPEQIKEFEAIADYSQKLKWWQERFDIRLEPQSFLSSRLNHLGIQEWYSGEISIYPKNKEEIKIFVDWYPNQATPIDVRKYIEQGLEKRPKSEWKNHLEKGYEWELQCGVDSLSGVWFSIGYNYEENIEEGARLLYEGITKERDKHQILMDFFSGLFVKRLKKAITEKKNNIADFEEIIAKNQDLNVKPLDNKPISTSQYLFIEYFIERKIGKPNPSMDAVVYYRGLVEKYGKTEEDYKKGIKRVSKIINGKMTKGQERNVRNDLKVVINYFEQRHQLDLAKLVEQFAQQIGVYLFE